MGKFNQDRDKRPSMHSATCAECGNKCEVPFKPTGDKPIYCNDCFGKKGGGKSDKGRSNRRDSGRSSMHKAICAECGNNCEIPFKPRSDKPVYCDKCFGGKSTSDKRSRRQSNEQLDAINNKLDKILTMLESGAKKSAVKKTTKTKAKAKPKTKAKPKKKSSKKTKAKKPTKKAKAKKAKKK